MSERSGMIFRAYDTGLRNETVTLIQKALSLMNVPTYNEEDEVRVNRDQKKSEK